MRRSVSQQTLAREEDVLVTFLASLSKSRLRLIAQAQPALLPGGSRLRGCKLLPNLWLARDGRFYQDRPPLERVTELSLIETLSWISVWTIMKRVSRAFGSVGIILEVPSEIAVR